MKTLPRDHKAAREWINSAPFTDQEKEQLFRQAE